MERVAARFFLALCIAVATTIPIANAGPIASFQEIALIQQNGIVSAVTDALVNALNKVIADAQGELSDFVRDRINSFSTFGQIDFDENYIELTVGRSSILDIFTVFPLSSQLSLPSISLGQVTYTFATKELNVSTREYGSQTVIPDVLDLNNIAFSFVVTLDDVSTLVVTFTGDVVLGGESIPTVVTYNHASGDTEIRADVSGVTINFQSIASQLVSLDLPSTLHGSITIPSFTMYGKVSSSGENELIISATGTNTHMYVIYKKADKTGKAIAFEVSNIELASMLNDLTGLDITDIPFFGTVVLPTIGLTLATESIEGLPDDIFTNSPLLSTTGNSIEDGLTAYILFDFSDDPIKLQYSGGLPTFQPATSGSLDIDSLISAIPGFDLSSIPLPPGVSGILQLSIDTFVLDVQTKSIQIAASYPDSLTFFDGFLTVSNPVVVIELSTQGIKLDVDGDLSISGSDFDVSIERDEESGVYVLSAQADELPITGLISQFQSEVLPSDLNSLISILPFFSFSIDDPSISFPLSTSPLQIQLGGTPVISGYNTVYMASVIIRQGGQTLLVQGFELGSFNLASFLTSVTGFNFNSIALLNLDLEGVILISPASLPNVRLTGDKLSGFSINKGVSVQASLGFPSDCSSDAFCAVAQFLLGEDAQLSLQGTIASVTSFTIFAGVANINLGSGIIMSEAGVQIRGGTVNSVGIVGAIDLSDPDITLAARIALSTSAVELEMTMSGCWENTFGASWLTICSLQGLVAMIPGLTLTALALGGEVHIGDDSCGTPLMATGFVGIDVLTPTRNYYYVNIEGSTTVGTVLDALCISVDVPTLLAESGFPNGFNSSFSLAGVELPHVPLSIPLGFRLKGTLNILGLEGAADVTIGLPDGIQFAVALPPINVGGLLQMYRSSSDQSLGPFLNADITLLPTPNVNIQASGYVSVLGITLEALLTITDAEYVFGIQGTMLNLFDACLHIAAPYGNIEQASFQVQGSFTNHLYDAIEDHIENGLNAASNEASAAVGEAQAELDRVNGVLQNAKCTLQSAQDELDSAREVFDNAVVKVSSVEEELNSICSTSSCGTVCGGCFDGLTCCGSLLGKCVCYEPDWNSCCFQVPDAVCEAANAACEALKAPLRLALTAARELVDASRITLEAANAALIPLQEAVKIAQGAVDAAKDALDGVKATFATALQAAGDIANLGLNGLISITEISFDVSLAVAAGGSFSGSVRASFLGADEVTVSLNINLHDIASMATQLADHIGNGFSSLF